MNLIQKFDDWYKEWQGESHLNNVNVLIHDSSETQDFANYCINEFKKVSIEYAKFCVISDRKKLPIIDFEDYINKLYKES